jgi:hypothetical protein
VKIFRFHSFDGKKKLTRAPTPCMLHAQISWARNRPKNMDHACKQMRSISVMLWCGEVLVGICTLIFITDPS